jgi:hypothetical protein
MTIKLLASDGTEIGWIDRDIATFTNTIIMTSYGLDNSTIKFMEENGVITCQMHCNTTGNDYSFPFYFYTKEECYWIPNEKMEKMNIKQDQRLVSISRIANPDKFIQKDLNQATKAIQKTLF